VSLEQVLSHVDSCCDTYVAQLREFVRIPSISAGADGDAAAAIGRAADFLVADFQRLELQAEKIQVTPDTNPLVLARPSTLSPQRPTVLIYGHYDVQGVDNPRSAWSYDPFAADLEDDFLLGRGASDDKGQLMTHLKALDAFRALGEPLPIDPIFLIEGEEECGSRALGRFLATGGLDPFAPLACAVVSDSSMYGPDRPSLTLGLRGIVYTEVAVRTLRQDVHSGLFGGIVHNPNHLLVRALASLFSAEGGIAVPGFYDDVREPSARERESYASLPVDADEYRRTLGVETLIGEPGYSLLEQRWIRPTLEINHLNGGSPRTVIPATAAAAISCRLVPDQDPARIEAALQECIRARLPADIEAEFGKAHASPPYYLDIDHPLVTPTLRAIRTGFDIDPVLTREGGSIPIVTDIVDRTGAPVLLVGFGQVTDNWHGPNERFSLRDYHRGIRTSAALFHELGQTA
jgi:acetylornithine deacetylase/succinyl-diaminopimelate desuccinylase-like protein